MRRYFTKKAFLMLGVAVFLPLLNGCGKSANEDKIIDIDKEFNIQLWEKLEETGGNLQLIVSTIQNQSCSVTRIDMSSNRIDSKLTVTIKSLIYPQICSGVSQPAFDTLTIGNMAKGEYSLNINLKDVVLNSGILTVDEKKFKVSMANQDGISVTTPELMRVPSGTIWGYVSFENGQDSKLLKFMDNLNKIAAPVTVPNGNYGHFVVGTSKIDIKSSFTTKKPNVRQIFHTLTKSTVDLENLITEYRNQGLDIRILTYSGKVF